MATSIPFSVRESCDTGFFACGTSQTGKTTTCKHLVKQLIDTKVYRCQSCKNFFFSLHEATDHEANNVHSVTLFQNGINVYVIDVSQAWTVNSPIDNVVKIEAGKPWQLPVNQSAVLDISELTHNQRIKFVIDFSKAIYEWHVAQGYKAAPIEFLFYEESHIYFPNGCFRSPRQFSPCIDVVTVGANFNLRFGAITQFPSMLDKALVKITQQRYFGRTTEKNDLSYAQSFLGNEYTKCPRKQNGCETCSKRQKQCIRRLAKGQFFYQFNETKLIQSGAYRSEAEKPQENFTINGQQVNFDYQLQDNNMTLRYVT